MTANLSMKLYTTGKVRENRVFLDSGIFIAFLQARDRWHNEAKTLFQTGNCHFYCSYLVISETYSWFLHREGEEAARNYRLFLASLPNFKYLPVDAITHKETLLILDKYRGSKLTFVDASSIYYIINFRVGQVWSTDGHLSLAGKPVYPIQ